jgi:hypothetical protein
MPDRGLHQVCSRRHAAVQGAHGGGRCCQTEGCTKAAATGGTLHCVAHGGGRRCQQEGCTKSVARAPGSTLCTLCLRATQPQSDGAEAQ